MNIALIAPTGISGGVSTAFHNLHRGLVREGTHVNVIRLSGGEFPLLSAIRSNILNAKGLADHYLTLIYWKHSVAKSHTS